METKNESYITEAGDIERWSGDAKQNFLRVKKKPLNILRA
jgi:hypothetical protein